MHYENGILVQDHAGESVACAMTNAMNDLLRIEAMSEPVTIADAVEYRINKEPIPTNRGFTDERVKEIAERQSDLYAEIGRQLKEIEALDAKLQRIARGALE